MSGTTPNIGLNIPDHGDQNWDVPVNQNWNTLDTAIAEKQATLTFDSTPTSGSSNPVTSGGIYSAIQAVIRNIGEIIQSTIPLTDAGLHLLDGSVISGSGSYSAFVTHIAGLVSGHSELFTTEANWQTSNDNYGACDKFVYDSVNNTVRLPKRVTDHGVLIKSYSAGTDWYRIYSDGWCEQGGICQSHQYNTTLQQVTFIVPYLDTSYTAMTCAGPTTEGNWQIATRIAVKTTTGLDIRGGLNANAAYTGDAAWLTAGYVDISDLQQTPVYEYIVIANTVKTPVEVDIDEVMTDLNGKVDKSDLAPVQCVIETYSSGTDWYRIWSDGWVEQGGVIGASTTSINLLKAYANTNYSVLMVGSNYGGSDQTLGTSSKTTSSFSVSTSSYLRCWYACGY